MKCAICASDAAAICKFCGRAVCSGHPQTKSHASGYEQKIKDNLWARFCLTAEFVRRMFGCAMSSLM
jgi:hypothetical protein